MKKLVVLLIFTAQCGLSPAFAQVRIAWDTPGRVGDKGIPQFDFLLLEPGGLPPSPRAREKQAREPAGEAEEKTYAAIVQLAGQGLDFKAIFQRLCARSRGREPIQAAKEIFGGLHLWIERGASPRIQGREDLASHFIVGGWLASIYGSKAAEAAGYHKELRDSRDPEKGFDLDDLAATLFGARWVDRTLSKPDSLEAWAQGALSLGSLAPLKLGRMPPRKLPPAEKLEAASNWADEAAGPAKDPSK